MRDLSLKQLRPTVEDYLDGRGVPWAGYRDRPIPLPDPVYLSPACGVGDPVRCDTLGDLLVGIALDPDLLTYEECI